MREVVKALIDLASDRPSDTALCLDDTCLSYRDLSAQVCRLARNLDIAGDVFGILMPNSLEWVLADLALAFMGKTQVPLPTFFSHDQLNHIVADAGVRHVLVTAETADLAEQLGLSAIEVTLKDCDYSLDLAHCRAEAAQRIIYTSGTTGTPKGVRLGDTQINASAKGLLAASGASTQDRYLSVLPFSLLLEQIAAICVPLLAGAPVTIDAKAAGAALQGDVAPLLKAFATVQPTASVMVPGLLKAWTLGLAQSNTQAPESLRFVAVGGAPVDEALAEQAWSLGIPVHEGYGLSECCSVVSVNRPGQRQAGTTGKPLDGTFVTIEDGEIVVRSNTVMSGYVGGDDNPGGVWRTGDLGAFTKTGALRVLGRKDNMIVTPEGRNIYPEWIEAMAEADPTVAKAKLVLEDGETLVLNVHLTSSADTDEALVRLEQHLHAAPAYARPGRIEATTETSNGDPAP